MRFWDLPGPKGFCEDVEGQLRDNKNLLIALPNPAPPGFFDALCEQLDRSGWNRVSIQASPSVHPGDCLFEQLGIDTTVTERRSPSVLSRKLEPRLIVVVDGISKDVWAPWKSFLSEYESVSRGIPSFERALLVYVVSGIEESSLPKGAIALGISVWQGVLSEIDMLSYAGAKVREKGMEGVYGQLIATTVARLAQWDVAAADMLLDADTNDLFLPQKVLGELAHYYGWKKGQSLSWDSGVIDNFNGRRQIHSAFLALDDPTQELSMRVWSSQASSLLPLIELHRRALIPKIRHRLKLPVQIDGEQINDALDLEIGSLAYMAGQIQIDSSIRAKIRKLRNVRNALAHLEVLDAKTALDPELLAFAQ